MRSPKTTFQVSQEIFGSDLPDFDKFLALNETYVHLLELKHKGIIKEEQTGDILVYTAVKEIILSKQLQKEIERRRTFGIISHPDAGKTTLTEKLLLFGGAIQMAGAVKARKASKHALSDWMSIEKERGISVTSSVMKFEYAGLRNQSSGYPRPSGFFRRHLPRAHSGGQRVDGDRRRQRRGDANPEANGCLPPAQYADHNFH